MMKRVLVLICIVSIGCITTTTTASVFTSIHLQETQNETFGGTYDDVAYSMKETFNHVGVLIAGSHGFADGSSTPYLVKPHWWNVVYSGYGSYTGVAYDAADVIYDQNRPEPFNAGYIMGGTAYYSPSDGPVGYQGIWDRIQAEPANGDHNFPFEDTGGTGNDAFTSVLYSWDPTDLWYLYAGYTSSFGHGGYDIWLVKTWNFGCVNPACFNKTWGDTLDQKAYSVYQTTDYGYIIGGETAVASGGPLYHWPDALLLKTDINGNEVWSKTYGTSICTERFNSVKQTNDGGYITTGNSSCVFGNDLFLVKVNSLGEIIWARLFGGPGDDSGSSVIQLQDGNYLVVGSTTSFGAGGSDLWVLKVNPDGDEVWNQTFGGSQDEYGSSILEITGATGASPGFRIAGTTRSFSTHGGSDVWYIETLPENVVLTLDPIGDKLPCDKFTSHGMTNLPAGEILEITISSPSLPWISGVTVIVPGMGGENTWSFDVDTCGLPPDTYTISIKHPATGTTVTGQFKVVMEPMPDQANSPGDPDDDDLYEDTNGNGIMDFDDAVVLFWNIQWVQDKGLSSFFDFNGNGIADYDDAVTLFWQI